MMKKKFENRHMVDVLFVITLFCMFAVCAILLIAVGAKVYQNTIDNMDTHFTSSTSMSYITEKIRQNDEASALSVCTFGNEKALLITQEINNEQYLTYIYSYGGYLKELFTKKGIDLDPSAGQNILAIQDFYIREIADSLFEITLVDKNHKTNIVTIGSKCNQ